MQLMQLTGYESGVVIYEPEGAMMEGFVSNWSSIDGLPRFFATGQIGLGDGDDLEPTEVHAYELDFAKSIIADDPDAEDDDPKVAGAWRNKDALVITFEGWN